MAENSTPRAVQLHHETVAFIAWRSGDCARRLLRGGAWNNGPIYLGSAFRCGDQSDVRSNTGGFRVAQPLRPTPPGDKVVGEGVVLVDELGSGSCQLASFNRPRELLIEFLR